MRIPYWSGEKRLEERREERREYRGVKRLQERGRTRRGKTVGNRGWKSWAKCKGLVIT